MNVRGSQVLGFQSVDGMQRLGFDLGVSGRRAHGVWFGA